MGPEPPLGKGNPMGPHVGSHWDQAALESRDPHLLPDYKTVLWRTQKTLVSPGMILALS